MDVLSTDMKGYNTVNPVQYPWSFSRDEVLRKLESENTGLSPAAARKRLLENGPNALHSREQAPWFIVFLSQFANPLVYILIAAALIKAYFKGPVDATVIGAVLIFMAVIGFIQEMKARKAMEALLKLSAPKAKVRREGNTILLDAAQLVPGDILIIEAGDRIATDARLLETANLMVNESPFTGESLPVQKHMHEVGKDAAIHDRTNMVFMSTTVSSGRAVAVVTATGMNTEIGRIAEAIHSVKKETTPLQKAIDKLGHSLIWIVAAACSVLFITGLLRGMPWIDVFMLAVAAAVSGIPEGLPATVTVVLAICVNRMSKRNVIIRKLTAVETLGTATVICTDKTGTLTLNQMTVREIWSAGRLIKVGGAGYEPSGDFRYQDEILSVDKQQELIDMLRTSAICNNAILTQNGQQWDIIGDPTEGALIVAAAKAGLIRGELEEKYPRLDEIPFESEKQFMSTLHMIDGRHTVCVKGSIEKVLPMCSVIQASGGIRQLDDEVREQLLAVNERMAARALRVLAIATASYPDTMGKLDIAKFSGQLILLGLIGMIDPPREEAKQAVRACKKAGIRVVMITGDNPLTAAAIAASIGISSSADTALTGKEIEHMEDAVLEKNCKTRSVFARIEPLHKLRIVKAFRRLGHITAMTGDGINDAPALEEANIGVAMGITGTDVAKEASDMVLTDDNFASIVSAVEEGRIVFNRLRNVAFFLLLTCATELVTILSSVALYGEAPFEAIQILWINLVTGSLAAIPLGLEPGTGRELEQPPRDSRVGLLYTGMVLRLFFYALIASSAVSWVFHHAPLPKDVYGITPHEIRQTVAFTAVVFFEWIFVLQVRSAENGVLKIGLFRNKGLFAGMAVGVGLQMIVIYLPLANNIFHTSPLTAEELLWTLLPGIGIFIIESIRKNIAPNLFAQGQWRQTRNEGNVPIAKQ